MVSDRGWLYFAVFVCSLASGMIGVLLGIYFSELHLHREDMESFYVLEGELTLYIGDRPGVRASAGSFAHVPGGTVHGFRVESETARYLILTTPRHGQFYRAITLPSQPGGLPPLESIDGTQIHEAAQKYGIEFVGQLPDGE